MPCRLQEDDKVTIGVLASKGQNNCKIARTLGVTEGTVRYHLKQQAEGAEDGRKNKSFQVEPLAEVIDQWFDDRKDDARPVNVWTCPGLVDTFKLGLKGVCHAEDKTTISYGIQTADYRVGAIWPITC